MDWLIENCDSIVKARGPGRCAATVTRHERPSQPSLRLLQISTVLLSTARPSFPKRDRQSLSPCQGFLTPFFPNITGCHPAELFLPKSYSQVESTRFLFPTCSSPSSIALSSYSVITAEGRWDGAADNRKRG